MTFQPPPPGPTASVAPVPRSIEVIADPTAIAAAYGELSRVGVTTPFQTRDWVAAWVAAGAVEGEAAIVTGWSGERLDFVLPFEILRVGAVAVARWMSGSHAGYNFGLWRREAVPDAGELAALFDTVGRRQRIDVFALDNMPRVWDGLANPIAEAFGATAALDDGHRFRLPARFDELIARRNAGHKRKKLKQKEKLLTAAGDYRIGRAVAVTEIDAALDAFFAQKAEALGRLGAGDPFARAEVRAFYRLLATGGADSDAVLELTRLEAGGAIRAVLGSIVERATSHQLFVSTARDDLARASPGETLFFRHIEAACAAGLEIYDMGLGAERYKASWCDEVVPLVSTVRPVGLQGRIAAVAMLAARRLKARIRRDERLWPWVRAFRARLMGHGVGEG